MKMADRHGAHRPRERERESKRERQGEVDGRQDKHHQDIRPGAICASNFLFLHKQTS